MLEIYLRRDKKNIDECIEAIEKQKTCVKGQPVAELYLSVLKAKFYLLHGQTEKGFNLFVETEKELQKYRSFPKLIFASLNEVKS